MRLPKRISKSARRDPADREKETGAREYNARVLDRSAERLEQAGDADGAAAARAAAAEARRPPGRKGR